MDVSCGPGHKCHIFASLLQIGFTFVLFPTWEFLFLSHLLLHQLLFLISFLFSSPCFLSPFASLSSHSFSPQPFFFLCTLVPSCLSILSFRPYLHVLKYPSFNSGLGRIFLFNSSFLGLERASHVYLGILGNRTLISEQGRVSPACVCVRQHELEGKASPMGTVPQKTENTVLLSLLADSAEQWPHFPGVLVLYHYTILELSLSLLSFVSLSVLFFSPIFHVSPCSLFSSGFPYLLEMISFPSLISLFGFGR